jgi:phospholipase/lecithinase/hemolysin
MPSYFNRRIFLASCLFAALVSRAEAGNLNAIYVFGDSLSDAGNAFIATGGSAPAPPYVNGHFTNGPVWVQDVAASLNLPPVTASLAGGADYAVGGAESGNANPGDLTSQLVAFKATNAVANPNGLYTIWIGANDLNAILAANPSSAVATAEAAAVVGNIDGAINTLAGEGAKNFLIVTVPDLGKTPAAIAAGPLGVAASSSLSLFFDTTLVNGLGAAGIPSLNGIAAADGLNLNVLDTYSLIDGIVANPAQFGLTNVTQACLTGEVDYAGGTPCANPGQYLFWDQLHPTAAAQAITAEAALQVLAPEPATWTMMLGVAGMLALVAVRRCRNGLLN